MNRRHHHGAALALCAVACLGGCAYVPAQSALSPGYSFEELAAAAANRDLQVEVRGNPFPVPQGELARTVAGLMPPAAGLNTTFTPSPANGDGLHRVVWDFAPSPVLAPEAICAGMDAPAPGPTTGVRVRAAFCRGALPLTSAYRAIEGTVDMSSPAFRDLVADVTHALLPRPAPAYPAYAYSYPYAYPYPYPYPYAYPPPAYIAPAYPSVGLGLQSGRHGRVGTSLFFGF